MNKPERIEFFAALTERSCCRFDRDGAAVIKLETDAQQMAEVMKLQAYAGDKLLRVTVEIEHD
jgi:hypothetical protein